MLTRIEPGTHCYVATLSCGCGVAIVADMPQLKNDTAKDVADLIKRGYNVDRLPRDEASAAFRFRCENYPHEEWQKRNEAAILKCKAKTLLSGVNP